MRRSIQMLLAASRIGILLALASGCQSSTTNAPAGSASPPNTASSGPNSEQDTIAQAMAGLAEPDRALALSQKVCPVSDSPLGSMGTPPKVSVAGREVFICCEGCREFLIENADKYLAKLPGGPVDGSPVPDSAGGKVPDAAAEPQADTKP